jgi:hypothetical protein
MSMVKIETEFFRRKARVSHVCSVCGNTISPSEVYYQQGPKDRFLQSLHAKNVCLNCYKNRDFAGKANYIPKEQKKLQ